jgi:chromosome partitioning protein
LSKASKVIVVANPKGGVGKSTLATNLAGYFARQGESVMLGDIDRQLSSHDWLAVRSPSLPRIRSWDLLPGEPARPPKGTQRVVLDTPAGLHDKLLRKALTAAAQVVVPLQPSMFDILATRAFLDELRELKAVRKGALTVGVVGMRVDARARSAKELEQFLEHFDLPVLGHLRNTQVYVQCAARGLSVFDVSPGSVARDLEQWAPILSWLNQRGAGS